MAMVSNPVDVVVSEVGPRDGLQSIQRAMPTAIKHKWIAALAASGLREIEVGSFVPPKRLPQMADAAEVVREAVKLPGLTVLALVPNLRGAENAIAAGAPKLTCRCPPRACTASRTSARRPRKPSPMSGASARCATACPRRGGPESRSASRPLSAARSQGSVAEDDVMRLARRLAEAGADSIGLSDTVGYANPAQVKRLFERLRHEIGDKAGGGHFHNTRGLGLANVVAALDAGVTTLRRLAGRPRRLPLRARRERQRRDRRPRLHARSMGVAPASTSTS